MGMRDQSWCAGCGQGIMYTDNVNAECGECATITAQSEILWFCNVKLNELKPQLEKLNDDLINNGWFGNDETAMQDYLEGAIDAYEIIINKFEKGYANA